MTNASAYEAAVQDVKQTLTDVERAIAQLGELPEATHIEFDVDAWTEKLTVKSVLPPKPTTPVGGWLLRG